MRGHVVALLAFCLLLVNDVVLQSTARLQPIPTSYNGALEKNGSALPMTLPPHLRDNRLHFVTSGPIRIKPTIDTNIPVTESVTSKDTSEDKMTETTQSVIRSTTQGIVTTTAAPTEPPPPTTTQASESAKETTLHQAITITTKQSQEMVDYQQATVEPLHDPITTLHQQTTTTQRPTSTTKLPTQTTTTERPRTTRKIPNHHNIEIRSGLDNNRLQKCPRSEDIHPCECVEVATPSETHGETRSEYEVETVAFCKNIRNVDVLREALRGMQGHHLTYFVMDSVHLPPFPNDLFKNVGVGWMEVLNSTIQFQQKFFQCYEKGCS